MFDQGWVTFKARFKANTAKTKNRISRWQISHEGLQLRQIAGAETFVVFLPLLLLAVFFFA